MVYRAEGPQRKQSADTLAEARAIKLKRNGEARGKRRGPTLHESSLSWLDRYASSGLAMPSTTRLPFPVATAERPIRLACAAACSSPPRSPPD